MTDLSFDRLMSGALAVCLAGFASSAILYGLFLRLGDAAGAVHAGGCALFFAGCSVVSTGLLALRTSNERHKQLEGAVTPNRADSARHA